MEPTGSIKNFSDFGIKAKSSFDGLKIWAEELFDQEIIVHEYKIEPSKKADKAGTDFLYVQITYGNEKRVLWTSSKILMASLKQIPETGFPFKAKIIKAFRGFEFRGV